MVTATTSSSQSTSTDYCKSHPNSDSCEKPTGSNAALPVGLGVGLPVVVAVVLSFFMYQRFRKRLVKEDEGLANIDISDMPIDNDDSHEKAPPYSHNVFEYGDETSSNNYDSPYLFAGSASSEFAVSKASIDSLHSLGGANYDGPYRFVNSAAISRPTSSNSSKRATLTGNYHPYQYRPYPLPNLSDPPNSTLKQTYNVDRPQESPATTTTTETCINSTVSEQNDSRDLSPNPLNQISPDEDSTQTSDFPLNRMNTIQESENSRPGTAASTNYRHSVTPSIENRNSFSDRSDNAAQGNLPSARDVDRSSDSSPDTSSNKYYISPFQSYANDGGEAHGTGNDEIVSRTSSVSPVNESNKAELSDVLPQTASLSIDRELKSDNVNHDDPDSAAERASRVRSIYKMYFDEQGQRQVDMRSNSAAATAPIPTSRRRVTPYIPPPQQQQQQLAPAYTRVHNSNSNVYRSAGSESISGMRSNSNSSKYSHQVRQPSASGLPAACKMGDDPFASPLIYSPPDKGYNVNTGAKGSMSPSSWGGGIQQRSPLADDDSIIQQQQPLPSASQLDESQLTGLGFLSPRQQQQQQQQQHGATSPRPEQTIRNSVLMEQVMQPVRPSWNMNR